MEFEIIYDLPNGDTITGSTFGYSDLPPEKRGFKYVTPGGYVRYEDSYHNIINGPEGYAVRNYMMDSSGRPHSTYIVRDGELVQV